MNKIQNIQALRGIAVLSVVFFHLLTIEQKYGGSRTILPDLFQFGLFGVDLFFVISGFVMVTVTRGKFQIPRQALRFIYHRVARIYPTYWVYSILVLIVFLLQPSWVNNSLGNQVDILSSFLLFPSRNLPLVMVGWSFGDMLAGAYMWTLPSGTDFEYEDSVEDFYNETFAGGREDYFLRALATGSDTPPQVQLQMFTEGFWFQPSCRPKTHLASSARKQCIHI